MKIHCDPFIRAARTSPFKDLLNAVFIIDGHYSGLAFGAQRAFLRQGIIQRCFIIQMRRLGPGRIRIPDYLDRLAIPNLHLAGAAGVTTETYCMNHILRLNILRKITWG